MDIFSAAYQSIKPRFDDDFADRANYYFTPSAFLLFALILTARQWIGQPIECWVPAEFKGAWEQYAEDYCFVQNTYWLPLNTPVPTKHNERMSRQIGYYQWVPFILALEALFFCFPYMVWWLLSWQTGIDINAIVRTAKQETEMAPETAVKPHVNALAMFIRHSLSVKLARQETRPRVVLIGYAERKGCYVTMVYLCVKLLYLINSISQLFLLTTMLTTGRSGKGAGMFVDILWGEAWEESGIFPRVTMCDFEVRILGNLNRYTVQCVLMINMFNEKIFLLLWFWVVVIVVLNCLSCLQWLALCLSVRSRVEYVGKYLRTQLEPTEVEDNLNLIKKFVQYFLRFDGVLLLRKLTCHCGDMLTTKLTYALFDYYASEEGRVELKKLAPSHFAKVVRLEETPTVIADTGPSVKERKLPPGESTEES